MMFSKFNFFLWKSNFINLFEEFASFLILILLLKVNQLMPDVLNGINENTMTSNKNAQLTSSKQQQQQHNPRQVSPKRQQKQNSNTNNNNNNKNSLNQNSNNQRLLQQQTQNQQQQQQQQSQMVNLSQILNQSTSGNSNDLSNFLLNMNGVNIDLESLVSSNIHHQQQQQQHQQQQQQQQQIICIQPDGNLVFQTVHQPNFQQQIFQQENNTFNSLENLNKPQQETNTLTNNKKRKNTTTPSSVTTNNAETKANNSNKKTKANTVACVLANGIQTTTTSESSPVKIKKNYKVANLLSSSENKLKVDLLPGQQFQLDSSMQQPQQWVLINSSNNLSQFTNMEAILSTNSMSNSENNNNNKTLNESNKNSIVKQKQKHGATKKEKLLLNDEANELMKLYHSIGNDDKSDYGRNNTSKTSNDTENKDDGSLLENENENENGGKKKRKACECPNCLK
jgi:hypothetical protein